MISELEKRISAEEDIRIMEKVKNYSIKEKSSYSEGYADAILYLNKLKRKREE